MQFLTNIDLNQNALNNAVIQPLGTAPNSPKVGQIYYDSDDLVMYQWNGSIWASVGGILSNNLVIKFDSGTTEGTDLYTFNGSTSKTIDIKGGTNVTITEAAGFITIASTDTNTATAADNILDGSNTGTEITYAPYASKTAAGGASSDGKLYLGTDNPDSTTRLNYDGYLYATKLYSGATEVSVSGHTHSYEPIISLGTSNQIWGMNNAGNAKEWKSFSSIGTTGTAPAWGLATANSIVLNIPMASTGSVTAGLLSNTDYGKIHTQNTDTGTTGTTFTLDYDNAGAGVSQSIIFNRGTTATGDAAITWDEGGDQFELYSDGSTLGSLRVNNLTVEGTQTIIHSTEVNIGDTQLLLNANITTSAQNSNGGIAIKRFNDSEVRKDAELNFNNTTGKWETVFGAVTGTLVTAQLANKISQAVGNGTNTSFVITHNLNTRDISATVHRTATPYDVVYADIELTSVNTLTIIFAEAPTTNEYTVTIVG